MTKLYRKSEIGFALAWIVAYIVLSAAGEWLSETIGVQKSAVAALHLFMAVVLFVWIRRNGLTEKYGLCAPKLPAKRFLFYLPLAVVASSALWSGFALGYGMPGTIFYVVSMCCVGFLEEVIFRSLLFRALEKNGRGCAIVVSSLTFGIGHIINLIAGQDLAETLVQIVLAIFVGFVLVTIFVQTGSLIPCIVFHALNNVLCGFANDTTDPTTKMIINAALTFVVLGGYLLYLWLPRKGRKTE